MLRRPDLGQEKIWKCEELKEIAHNLALLSVNGGWEFYERAYRERRISSRDFPPARAVQELASVEAAAEVAEAWMIRGVPFISGKTSRSILHTSARS